MTTDDYKKALKQMSDFHAAIVHAYEVSADLDVKEKRLAAMDKEVKQREDRIKGLEDEEAQLRASVPDVQAKLKEIESGHDKRKIYLEDQLSGIKADISAAGDELVKAKRDKLVQLKELEKEILAKQGELDAANKSYDNFMASLKR